MFVRRTLVSTTKRWAATANMASKDSKILPPAQLTQPPNIPLKKLFGPGPSNVRKQVGDAQTQPMLGHLHTEFLKVMDDVREGVKYVFQTRNALTFVVSGTGHAGMECAILNCLEAGERLLVVRNGLWGERAANLGKRLNLNVSVLNVADGEVASLNEFRKAVQDFKPHAVFICQGESSTGVLHPLEGFGPVCHENGALLIVDTVASLGATPFDADLLEVDCVYSATQKVLNAPPGLSPISFSDRAVEKLKSRKTQVASFYLDALEIGNYWGCFNEPRRYHHTGMVSLVYSLREALAAVAVEGLDQSIERHQKNVKILYRLLNENGFDLFVEKPENRLPCLTTVKVPPGVDWKAVQDNLMSQGWEIAGGLGATAGKIWRIGTFGINSDVSRFEQIPKLLKAAAKL
uniref:Alanine--glyoxylate aminotransferase n=1 Tax=Bursaphelenchus xylophilus TaxID=6326 RepID=A0A1I7SWC1_BURXY